MNTPWKHQIDQAKLSLVIDAKGNLICWGDATKKNIEIHKFIVTAVNYYPMADIPSL